MLPEPVRQVRHLYDRWQHHRSPPPQFRYGTRGEGNILQSPALVVSAATAHKTFGPIDLTNTYSECTWRVENVKLGGHQTCLSINRLRHELCDMLHRLVGTTAPGHHDCSIQE
ncbi:uncharacterized protein TNCV_3565481 [Trichonephila clavipes]|nr:uncharacterized protein TNCV_3565481 [Trichonephila clavipes]